MNQGQSQQQSLEQKRAAAAWNCIVEVRDHNPSYKGDYGALARNAPADIQTNGLGQTLAFWRAKGKDYHKKLYADVSAWMQTQIPESKPNLLEWIMQRASTGEYRRASAEAMAFLNWLKRFAEAELDSDKASQ
jgi:CRISPR-associated protein Cmr5